MIKDLFFSLNYDSYVVQREAGATHEQLAKYACWNNPKFKTKYDNGKR